MFTETNIFIIISIVAAAIVPYKLLHQWHSCLVDGWSGVMSGQSEKIEQIKIEQAVRKAELASTMHTQVCSL